MPTINKLKKFKTSLILAHDAILGALSIYASLYLRLGDNMFAYFNGTATLKMAVILGLCCLFSFKACRLNSGTWRFVSLYDVRLIVKSVSLAIICFFIALFMLELLVGYPRSALIINWFVLAAFLAAPRFVYRMYKDKAHENQLKATGSRRVPVLLAGDGAEADIFIRAMNQNLNASYRVVGIISDDKGRIGRYLHNVKILGSLEELTRVFNILSSQKNAPQKLIISDSNIKGELFSSLINEAEELGLNVYRLPRMDDLKSSDGSTNIEIRPIAIEDLLPRPQRVLDHASMQKLIKGKRVLVTGGGGSIGSELVRQIAGFAPELLAIMENCEFNLYSIDMEISKKHPNIARKPLIGDVRDKKRINDIMEEIKPDLVFHAAALKHVPMTEANPMEGVITNSVGTMNIANACSEYGVKAMVMISTDKAVNPTNVMGATKRLAESYCQAMDIYNSSHKGVTKYVTVRFGNVLGSTGSVIPLFKKQIAEGGPVTVTHPDMKRYFMTIKEAVELVLQASVLGYSNEGYNGKIFVLEMGEPVKILDLAKQVIRLAGLTPDEDIKIEFSGLRPGEKLFEEIFHSSEPLVTTESKGILLAEPRLVDKEVLENEINSLYEICRANEPQTVINKLKSLIPEFDHRP